MLLRSVLSLCPILLCTSLYAQTPPCANLTITNGDELAVCSGESVSLRTTLSLPGASFSWAPAEDFGDQADSQNPTFSPQFTGFYTVTATAGDCQVKDSVFIDVDNRVVPDLIDPQTVCQGTRINLLASPVSEVGDSRYLLLADGDTIRSETTDPNFRVKVDSLTEFTLVTKTEGPCNEVRRSVTIDVVPGLFEISQDTVFACLGADSLVLSVVDTPSMAGRTITWSPNRFGDGMPSGNTFTVLPTADITYFAETTINGCPRIDSVAVRLDSLPSDLSLTVEPEKDPYCQGDTIIIRTPTFDVGDFPLIQSEWTEAPGLQSPRELLSAVFVAQDTAVLTRVTTNGACTDTARTLVNVVEPPEVTFEPADPVVCPGEAVQITATFVRGEGTLSWEDPGNTLSCTDCLNPVATVETSTEYTIEVLTGDGNCTSDLSYTVRVDPAVDPVLNTDVNICPGDSRPLIIGNVDPSSTYRITGGGTTITDPLALVSPTQTTTYTIETTGSCGTFTSEVTLIVGGDYTVAVSAPESVCAGEELALTASVDPEDTEGTYNWTLPGGVQQSGQSISVADPISGTYVVTFRDAAGCASATDSVSVEVLGDNISPIIVGTLPDGTSLPSNSTVFAGSTVELSVINLPPDRTYTFDWTGNYEPPSGSGNPFSVTIPRSANGQVPDPLNYTVTVTTDEGGCTFEATYVLFVEQSTVLAPDFFTPDNDGRNDRFRLFYNGTITDYTMIVFDRWGQKVFTSDDPQEGWDGTKDGTPQSADVYLYVARFRQDGLELTEEGQVSLLR